MISKKLLGSGIVVIILITTIVGIAIYINYTNFGDNANGRTITDSLGRKVNVPDSVDIEKIVGINAGCLRLLVYMDVENLVCGVEEVEKLYSARPYTFACPELADLPEIGPQFGGDPELILAQEPDVIFSTYITIADADELQQLTGIPVVELEYGDLNEGREDFYNSLRIIGEVLDKKDRAEILINDISDMIEDLNNRTKDIPDSAKKWCYVGGIGHRGTHGITSTECQYSPLAFVNGKNSAENVTIGHAFIDIEQLFQWEADNTLDYILVDAGGYDMCMADLQNKTSGAGAGDLECIKANPPNAVITLPYNWYTTNFGTVIIDAYYLGKTFFPNQFADLNYTNGNIYNDIFEKFVGERVYEDMANTYVPGYEGFHNITHTEIDAA
ncbi:MAG: ABC transporter substrate-binding protein [Candidatus Odinarchaeota archaeon]